MSSTNPYDLIIFTDWFLPASKAGGPISSISNLVEQIRSAVKILIVTGDRDLGDAKPFSGIWLNEIQPYKRNVDVYYLDAEHQNKDFYTTLLDRHKPAAVYLNSMFSYRFSLIPVRLLAKAYPEIKTVLAPRGMLHPNALKIKALKKRVFLLLFKLSRIPSRISFQATDENEVRYIQKIFGKPSVLLANAPFIPNREFEIPSKAAGELRLITTSRVSHEKNTLGLYRMLKDLPSGLRVTHTLIGPSEKVDYWKACQSVVSQMKNDVRTEYLGPMNHGAMLDEMAKAHAFILPTLGENFGHSIFEALSLGKPVIISNLTPWTALQEKEIGWDLRLNEPHSFTLAMQELAAMDDEAYKSMALKALSFARDYVSNGRVKERYLELFGLQDMGDASGTNH